MISKTRQEEPVKIGMMELVSICGFACYFAWFLLVVFGTFFDFSIEESVDTKLLVQMFAFLGMAVASFVVNKVAGRINKLSLKIPTIIIAMILSALLPIYTQASYYSGIYIEIITIMLMFISGAITVFLITEWEVVFGLIRSGSSVRYLSLSMGLGGCLFLLISIGAPSSARDLFALAFLIVAGPTLLLLGDRLGMYSNESEQIATNKVTANNEFPLDKRISVFFVLFGISFGLSFFELFRSTSSTMFMIAIALATGGTLVILAIFHKRIYVKDEYILILLKVFSTVVALVFLIVAVTDVLTTSIALIALCAFWFVVWILMIGVLLQHAKDYNLLIPKHTSHGKIANNTGFLLGWVIGLFLLKFSSVQQSWALISVLIVAFSIISVIWLLPVSYQKLQMNEAIKDVSVEANTYTLALNETSGGGDSETSVRAANLILSRKCSIIAKRYQLSLRESEILFYLAKGHNIRSITKKLVISEHTVKTHVYHIYQKMGIHSQQSLINIFEVDEP